MFSRIPAKFATPFGLLGDGPKLAFRSQPSGIAKLAALRNIPESDTYWDQYIVLFDTASDVYSLISPHDIRRALLEAPENVATLIRVICSRLFNLISDHTFPSPPNTSVASLTSFIKTTGSERNATKEVLNCLRVLQRVLPVVFEIDGDTTRFELDVLWKRAQVHDDDDLPNQSHPEESQFVIEDDDGDDEDDHDDHQPRQSPSSPSPPKESMTLPSLAERLFSSLTDLLFCCGFTLPLKIQKDHYKINYVIWEKGVGSTADPGPSQGLDSNKAEVLRLLLVLLSRQIYTSPSSLLSKPSIYTLHVVQKTPRRNVLTLLCSLLNTAMNSTQPHNLIGGVAGKLPYNHLVFKGEDPRATLVGTCLQVLCVLLDFQSGSARDVVSGSEDSLVSGPTAKTNAFRYFLAKLHRTQDFAFVLDGVIGILQLQMASFSNYLPGSRKSVPYIVETIVFFWKMIDVNKKFRSYLLDSDKGTDVLGCLLCYSLEIKDKPQQHGLCRSLSYIIQTLSAERAFGLQLSSPIKAQLPPKWNVNGTVADLMINSIYSMVATTSGTLNSLYPAFIISLSNSAPYFKNLSVSASTRLVQLVTAFSNPTFLLSDEGHPRLLYFMLEVFNSVVLHNLTENPNLIYAMLRAHKVFEKLGTFTLARGLREIRRVQLAKEELARKVDDKGKSPASDVIRDDEEPQAEKARLLESEADLRRESADNAVFKSPDSPNRHSRSLDENVIPATPLMSSTSEDMKDLSEKARGKMKAKRSTSTDMTRSLEMMAAAGIGRNNFVPTQEWVTSWQQGLPLDPVMLVMSELLPKVLDLQKSLSKSNTSTAAIIDFISSASLSHVLPQAHLSPRRFVWTDSSIIWLTSLIWGEIYIRGMTHLGIWNSTTVRLFYVKHAQSQQRGGVTETVTNALGGFLGRGSSGGESPRA